MLPVSWNAVGLPRGCSRTLWICHQGYRTLGPSAPRLLGSFSTNMNRESLPLNLQERQVCSGAKIRGANAGRDLVQLLAHLSVQQKIEAVSISIIIIIVAILINISFC